MVARAALWRASVRALWTAAAFVAAVVVVELLLQELTSWRLVREAGDPSPMGRLNRAYAPFAVQHLHPHYLFFFPLDPVARVALGNAACSLDAYGFREPGPADAGGRKLAVMLGGSSAFGYYASSNQTTITSYLNGLQDEYFFVNGGVPSWNSTQELFRLAIQIAPMHPALVIAYDGANDAGLADRANPRTGASYPPGTPESFDALEHLVDDLRTPSRLLTFDGLLPEITQRVRKYRDRGASGPRDTSSADGAARQYVDNQEQMAALAAAAGARFMTVFQPIAGLHHNVEESAVDRDLLVSAFHAHVLARRSQAHDFHDLSAVFDGDLPAVPVAAEGSLDGVIFIDEVHLSDRGNQMVAGHLLKLIQGAAK